MFVYYCIFQQRIPNWKSLIKNSILSDSSPGAHWELSGSLLQLRVFYLAWPAMPNKINSICTTYSGFILCLFRSKPGSKPFRPILTVTQ